MSAKVDTSRWTQEELDEVVHRVIGEKLGVAALIRFLQDRSVHTGDYTADRHQWLDPVPLDLLLEDLEKVRLKLSSGIRPVDLKPEPFTVMPEQELTEMVYEVVAGAVGTEALERYCAAHPLQPAQ